MLCIMARKKTFTVFIGKSYRMPRYIHRYNVHLFEQIFFEIQEQIVKTKQKKKTSILVKGSQIQNIINSHFLAYTSIQIHSSALL